MFVTFCLCLHLYNASHRVRFRLLLSTCPSYQLTSGAEDLDRLIERHHEATQALIGADDGDPRRAILSPPPLPPPREQPRRNHLDGQVNYAPPPRERTQRIGFGGAVFRARDRQINYEPLDAGHNPPRRIRFDQYARPLVEDGPLAMARADMGDGEGYHRRRGGRFDALFANLAHAVDMARGFGVDVGNGIAGGAGRREDDVGRVVARLPLHQFEPPREGFTVGFEIDSTINPPSPIILDDDGRVVRSRISRAKPKPYLACANCTEALLVSSAYRTPSDRVWALRCGHLVDQRCLEVLSAPKTATEDASVRRGPPGGLPIMGTESVVVTRGRGKRARVTKPPPPAEYRWSCPVEGCGRTHVSVQVGEGWTQKEDEGARQVYA